MTEYFLLYKKFRLPCAIKKEKCQRHLCLLHELQHNGTEKTSVSKRQTYEYYLKVPNRFKLDLLHEIQE